LLPWLRSSFRG